MASTELSPMYRCPDGNIVQFYEMAVPNEARSLGEGRPVIYRALMAKIRSPGMKNQIHEQEIHLIDDAGKIVRRKVSNTLRDKRRVYFDEIFKDQLAAYKEGRDGTEAMGTPLEQYPKIDVARAATLRASGVYSLEQLAAVPDAQLDQLGPHARQLRDDVKKYLDSMTGNTALREQLEALKAQVAALTAANGAAEPARRGRPPKAAQEAA